MDEPAPGCEAMLVTHSLGTGGTERVTMQLAQGLSDHGEVAVFKALAKPRGETPNEMLDSRVAQYCGRTKSRGRTLDFILALPSFVRALRSAKPKRVVATGNNNAWFTGLGVVLSGLHKTSCFVKITNPIIRHGQGVIASAIRRAGYFLLFYLADTILVLSDAEGSVIADLFPPFAAKIRMVVNPYVTDSMLDTFDRRARRLRGSELRVLAIGRLHAQKNLPLLLHAWASAAPPSAVLELLGDGPERPKLEQLAKTLGIAESVHFRGYQGDITPNLAMADLLVLSSDYEGLPAVVLEAMAAGCPVLATDSFPAAQELVGTAPGCFLVPPGNLDAFAGKLACILDSVREDPLVWAELRDRARPYTMDAAIASHAAAIGLPLKVAAATRNR